MKKYFFEKRNVYKIVAAVTVLMLIVAVLPLLYIGRYAHPCADDYTYGYYTHVFWTTTNSLGQALKWAIYKVKATYDTWQGTFSSVFLMAISPAAWGEDCYAVTPFVMLTMTIVPNFYLLYGLLVRLLGAPKSIWCIISSTISFCIIEHVYSPVNAFFWYNGAVHYTFMHGCMLLLFGIVLNMGNGRLRSARDKIKYALQCIAACVLALACGGGNYATALVGILGLLFLLLAKWYVGSRLFCNWFPAAVYAYAFYKSVTAYGNTIRQDFFTKAEPLDAIIGSFGQLFECMRNWINLPIILFMLFLIPFWWKATDTERYRFRVPVIVTVVSIGACACMFTPALYAMNSIAPDRLLNIAQMWFYLLLFLNEGYWLGSLHKLCERKDLKNKINVNVLCEGGGTPQQSCA